VKTFTIQTPSKRTSLFIVLAILLVGLPLTLLQSEIQQIFKQFAWQTTQSAEAVCAPEGENTIIGVKFTNRESTRAMDVVAKDIQTGKTADLGTVDAGKTAEGEIVTETTSLRAGSVVFTLTWTNGTPGTDTFTANYGALDSCNPPAPTPPMCPDDAPKNQGYCRWDGQDGAVEYKVLVKETESGDTVKEETVQHPTHESSFTMEPGKSYQCSVTSVNDCGTGDESKSPEKVCQVPTPTPYCPANPIEESSCVWDTINDAIEYKVDILDADNKKIKSETVKHPNNRLTFPSELGKAYRCSVTPIGKCSQGKPTVSEPKVCVNPSGTPAPTETPGPTETPALTPTPTPTTPPTVTPTPLPTATPVPTATPAPTTTPVPTNTPAPTPTSAPTPTNRPTPTPRIIQQPGQTIVQRGGVQVVQQPGRTVVQPGQTVVQQQPNTVVQTTPRPTVAPTGDNTAPVIVGGVTLIMALAGAILFFAL
jgi:predicted RNA-binding protein with TRAM domain